VSTLIKPSWPFPSYQYDKPWYAPLMDLICLACGKRLGTHHGWQCSPVTSGTFDLDEMRATGYPVPTLDREPGLIERAMTRKSCVCGGAALGYARGPLHSRWCADYDDTPPVRGETHEELVARVRAARKGART